MNIKIIGKKGSHACKEIREGADIKKYTGQKRGVKVNLLINYGLTGENLRRFYRRIPSAKRIPTLNAKVGHSKIKVIQRAKRLGIRVPESKVSLGQKDKKENWIEKRINSQGGKGICKARGKRAIRGKYYQRFVRRRSYEIRVHAFRWMKTWPVQKRYGKRGEIAWNFNTGGHFVTVSSPERYKIFREAIASTEKIMKSLGMAFGAADFIVDSDGRLWFIEINSAPGFQELSRGIYINAFKKLKKMKMSQVSKYAL
jgi:hypothetical protein